jgi:hypothetical protein
MKNTNKKIAEIFKSETSRTVNGIHICYETHDDKPDHEFALDFIYEFTMYAKQLCEIDVMYTGRAWPTDLSKKKSYELMFESSKPIEKYQVQEIFSLIESKYVINEYSSVLFVEDIAFEDCEVLRRNFDLTFKEIYNFENI